MTESEANNDNRFALVEKYKQKLIEATNIETNKDEMAVIDNILFRLWQMGWLDLMEKQENGLIIELPAPIGSDVWLVHKQDGYCTVSYVDMMIFPLDLIEEWGKTVFATREEAEKRLEELKNERL